MLCLLDTDLFDEDFYEAVEKADRRIFSTDKLSRGKMLSVYGRALLGFMLWENYGIEGFSYDYGKEGKPYLKNENIYFNISHSGKYVLCCTDKQEIGCDIEKVKEYNPKISKRFFTEKENELLENSDFKEKLFTKMWTNKESILKKTGVGITGGLDSYCFADYAHEDSFSAYGYVFSCFSLPDYELTLCAKSREKELLFVSKEKFTSYINAVNSKNT